MLLVDDALWATTSPQRVKRTFSMRAGKFTVTATSCNVSGMDVEPYVKSRADPPANSWEIYSDLIALSKDASYAIRLGVGMCCDI